MDSRFVLLLEKPNTVRRTTTYGILKKTGLDFRHVPSGDPKVKKTSDLGSQNRRRAVSRTGEAFTAGSTKTEFLKSFIRHFVFQRGLGEPSSFCPQMQKSVVGSAQDYFLSPSGLCLCAMMASNPNGIGQDVRVPFGSDS